MKFALRIAKESPKEDKIFVNSVRKIPHENFGEISHCPLFSKLSREILM
jgi:hypothetical protein